MGCIQFEPQLLTWLFAGNPDKRANMLEQWMIQLEKHPDQFKESELYGVANATVGAGADTISATLQAFWYHLLRNPEAFAKLRTEIDTATMSGQLSVIVSYAEAQKLPYLQACVGIHAIISRECLCACRSKKHFASTLLSLTD